MQLQRRNRRDIKNSLKNYKKDISKSVEKVSKAMKNGSIYSANL